MKCFGRRQFGRLVKIILLDDQEIIQEVQKVTRGQELLDIVFKHLNVIEASYFGLRFVDTNGQAHWLDPGKHVVKQIYGTDPATLYFGVKFYAADPCKLYEEITRYQFFLQIKKDILHGRLSVSNELAAQLGAHAVQSELGDYDPKRHGDGYISEFRFVENQSVELESRICELHKTMAGEVPAVAELNYLEKVKWLDMYGVDLHPVLGEDKIDYFLGLTPSGVIVLRNKNKVGNYFWPRITKISMKGKYFIIRVKNRAEEETYGFETPSKAACKHLWKCAMDHHTFFRLVQVTPTASNTASRAISLNNRFRGSNHSNISSASRRRAQPQFIRTPSRRYVRRYVEGSEVSTNNREESQSLPQSQPTLLVQQKSQSWGDNAPSVRSVPYTSNNAYSVPSPRSTRSRKRSQSVESNSSCEEETSRRHHHSRRKHRHSRTSSRHRQSDGESETSAASRGSSKKRYRHKSNNCDNSGSESEVQQQRRRRHRHRSGNEVIEWKEATMSTIQQSVSSVKVIGGETDTQSAHGGSRAASQKGSLHRTHRHHHARRQPTESQPDIKKYFHYELIDTEGMSREELNNLPYMNVVTSQDPALSMKNRVLLKQHKHKHKLPSDSVDPHQATEDHSSMSLHSTRSTPEVTTSKMCVPKGEVQGDNSPPPPYSPPSDDKLPLGLPPIQSARGRNQKHVLEANQPGWSSSLNQKKNQNRSRHNIYEVVGTRNPESVMKEHLENSDSGLGTDREYYRETVMSSLSYALPSSMAVPQRPPNATQPHAQYWNAGESWQHRRHENSIGDAGAQPRSDHLNVQNRSSSLEMILSPLVSSTTNRTRL